MRDPFRWSISLGRWGTANVRLHVFFLVFAAATYILCWQDSTSATGNLFGMATAAMAVLLVSVAAHEWAHWLIARQFDFAPSTLVLGPLGGVSQWPDTARSLRGFYCMLAGPAVNLLIALCCALLLNSTSSHLKLFELFNPLAPAWTEQSTSLAVQGLQLTLWINWLLFLANLLPAFPFDGGRILRSALAAAFPTWPARHIAEFVFWIAVVLSAGVMTAALIMLRFEHDTIFPTSFALLLLAVVLLVSARRDVHNLVSVTDAISGGPGPADPWHAALEVDEFADDQLTDSELEDDEFADEIADADADEFADADEYSTNNAAEDEPWTANSAADDVHPSPDEIEADEERRVDTILSRLHTAGLDSLSADDRDLLERVSARYRGRLGK